MRNPWRAARTLIAGLALAGLTGCVVYDRDQDRGHRNEPRYDPRYQQNSPGGVQQGGVHVPPGHLPPPGMCRIWYPGTPPGHQPPPDKCKKLRKHVPPGAVLVHG